MSDSLYLAAEHQPVTEELTVTALKTTGPIPQRLEGLYVRNSPNPQFAPLGRYHWFDGDGMVHGVRFTGGQASYRNRWVRTAGFERERAEGQSLWTGIMEPARRKDLPGGPLKDTANTDLVFHQGRLYALWWLSGTPMELDVTDLSTKGPQTFEGKLGGGFSAHPKVDPRTHELVFFDYSLIKRPFLRYGVVSAAGKLERLEAIETKTPHIQHDMAITEHFSVLMDFPLGWDLAKLKEGKRRIAFDRDTPSRFGVIPRHGSAADLRWFEAEPCYMYHSVNAYEAGDELVLVGCRVKDIIPERQDTSGQVARLDSIELVPHLYEWRFNLKTGQTRERQLDDVATEFPRINDGVQGVRARYAYHPRVARRAELMFDGLLKYAFEEDGGAKVVASWTPPQGYFVGEASFAGQGVEEDDGFLVTYGTNAKDRASAAFIVDAKTMQLVSTVHLPQRIPLGFHSYWCPGRG
jgi:carotenoid cleavage dioxygenase-like enzyme